MIRAGESIFVDSGAWIALAQVRDPLHQRAVVAWQEIGRKGLRLSTSVPVVLETFTFLERNTTREVALAWKDSLETVARLRVLDFRAADLPRAWNWFRRRDLHKLSAVDATSFALMSAEKIRLAFTFDHHFSAAGFRIVD